ncbi:MAG: TetR/AcrR family transcriptional regulator [Clostridia bacterium]|nr:TetR/AcrR family transcriptional regulator [Clostridia bacterium]
MEQEKKTDRRVLRTKKAIHNAFVSLLAERSIDDISISEIAKRADINRKTFYSYYGGIHMLLNEIEQSVLTDFVFALSEIAFESPQQYTKALLNRVHAVFSRNLEFYRCLLLSEKDSYFSVRVSAALCALIKDLLQKQIEIDDTQAEISIRYILSGIFSAYRDWFAIGQRLSEEEFFSLLEALCFNGVNHFFTEGAKKSPET